MLAPAVMDMVGLGDAGALRESVRRGDQQALHEVAVQFEAMVLGIMLKAAREATPGDGMMDGGGTSQYLELMDRQVALQLARGGALGLARLIGEKSEALAPAATRRSPPAPLASDPVEFVGRLWPFARDAAADLGTDPRVLVAQAALESAWGQGRLVGGEGRSTFNVFSVKAGRSWPGSAIGMRVMEFVDGVPERRWESFRAYGGLREAFDDYVRLIRDNPRYESALGASRPEDYIDAVSAAGFATDPDYASKWRAVLDGERLRQALASLKIHSSTPTQ